MEHQELEPLATALLPLDVDGDDDDEEYKVESDAEADDTESDEGDEQDVHPQEEDTLHLLDIADDLLGNLDEDVLSDSECVESDSEDDDEEACTGVAAAISSPQQQSSGEMDKHAAVRMPQQERPTHEASARRAQQAGLQDVDRNPDESFAAQQSTPLRPRCGAPLCNEGRQQQQWIPQRDADCSPNWDAASTGMAATPVLHGRQDTQKAGNGGTLSTAAAANGPVGIATPLAPGPATQKDPDGSPCRTRGNAQMREQPLNGQQDKPHGQMHGQDRPQEHGQVVYPPSGGICRRTRTHVSLRDVDLSELEQQLPDHIDLEEIELAEDDEEYGKFLQTLFDDTAALPEDSSDEDPDFAADLDLDLDKASKDDDDDDDDRGWLKLLNPPEREGSRNMTIRGEPTEDSPARRTRARSKRGSAKGGAAGASESGEAGGVLEMTAEQLSVLHAQVHCHTQLLLQTYLMFATDTDSEAHDLAMKAKAMLEQLAMCRDAQSTTRKLLGFASYAPEDLLRPAAVAQPLSANTAPVASTGLATSGGAHGDRPAASGSAEGGDAAAATASSCAGGLANELRRADAWECGRALTQPRGLQHTQGQLPAGIPMVATAAAAMGITTTYTQGHSEISQDEISMGGNEWDGDPTIGSAAAGMPAVKAAAAARSASLNAAILAFRPTWCPGPEGGVWSVLDVVPLRKFPEVQGVLQTLPAMPYSTMKLQRDLQAIAKSKRKKRRRRMDDPLLAALDWARPALQCLQSHLLTALMYHPSPPVPPSYWTFAEDDLMIYGMSRHGTNWRLIAKTLLVTRNASQIANRYKNLNARRRMPEEHMDDGRAEEHQTQALPTTAPGVAGGSAARKPKSGPAARPKAPGPGAGPGVGVGIGQAAGPSALTRPNTLQVAAALPVATGLAGAGANTAAAATVASAAALLTQPMLPELAAMVHSARIVGLPPAVAAAHIIQAQQQLRPHLQPPHQAALPQVPFSVAVQLLQMAKAGGMTGPGAAAARLLAAQLQEPHTAMAVISALQSATHQVMAQPIDSAGVLSAAATAAAASQVTAAGPTAGGTEGLGGLLSGTGAAGQSGGTGSAGCLDGAVDLGVPSILAQLLQARLATNNAAALGTTLTQQASQVASKLFLQAAAPGVVAKPLPLAVGAAQQALLSLRQTTASLPVGINAQGEGPAAAVAAVGSAALAEPQPVAKKDQSDVAVGEVACNGSGVVIPVAQHRRAGAAALLSDGAAKPIDAPRPWQEHDCEQNDPMHWTLQSPSSPSCPVARGNGGGNCASGVHATVVAAVAAPPRQGGEAGLGIDLPRKSVAMAAVAPWQQPAHCGLQEDPPCSVLTRSMAVTDVLLAAEARGGAAADAVLHTGPTDPRLSHGKELPGHHPQQRAHFPSHSRNLNDLPHQQQQQPGHYQRGEVSPGEQFLHHGRHDNHELQGHQQEAHHDLPSLSDNFTLGGISELLGHGVLKSGAATPATCVSPQGGLTSGCLSHGHTMSLLLGSALGISALLRSDADGDSVTSTKSAAGGPLHADEPLCENDQEHRSPCGRQVPSSPCEPQTKEIGDKNADGANALEVMVATLRTPGGKNQPGATAPPPPPRLLTPQRFSPNSPTDAEGAACLKGREAALPPRIAALRGLDLTPSSDPKARRRSRIGTAEHTAGRTMLHALAPSPFEGTAQNHREGRGERNGATVASYCPRPPLFAEEPGAEGQHFCGGCLRFLEGSVIVEEDDEEDAAAEGLARARKRLRLDVEDEVSGAAKVPRPLLFEPLDAATTAAPINVHSLGPVANSVEASPASLAGAPPAAAAAAGLVSTGLVRTIFGHQPEPQQQWQQLADTGSSGDSKRRSESTDMTSGGGSKRVRPGQASGRLESDGADAAAAGRGPGRRGALVEAVAALDMTAKDAATDQVCGGRDGGHQQRPGTGHQPCRVAGQKRSRSGAGQKPTIFDKDGTAWVAASGPLCLPLAAADTNINARTTEAVVAGPAVSPSGSCAVAGVSAVSAKISMKHHNPCIAPTAAGDAETASKAATDGISVKPAGGAQTGLVAKPPKAPTRKGAGWAQRLTRVSAAAGARPVPSTRQRRPSEPNGARFGSTVPASAPPSTCTSPETSRATHVAAMAAISSSPRSLHMLLAPGSAADSEVSSGGMSLHSLLCSADTLDIASLLPSMSTRSLAAAVVNVCSPTSRPDTGSASAAAEKPAAPVTRSSHNPVDMAAPVLAAANSSADVGPNADASLTTAVAAAAAGLSTFMSPPRSQLMQLTPFAHSGCTLGSSDILPLFSNSTDLWNALQVGSALGTTSRGPEARVVAGSTAAGEGSGEGPNGPSEAPSSITPLDPWSRFMASCSPSAETQEEAALLPSCHEYSLSAFHTFLASIAGPRNTVADATVTMVAAATTTATEHAVIKESSVSEPGQSRVWNGTGTSNRGAAAGACVAGPIVPGDQASGDVTPAAPPDTAAVVVVVAGGTSSCQELSRPKNASGLPPLEVATRATGPSGAEAQPTRALEASGDVHGQQPRAAEAVAGVQPWDGKASAGLESPGPRQHHAPDTCAAAVAMSKPVGGTAGTAYEGLLPPLPPAFSRHGSAPSPIAQPPSDSRPPAPETVRLFGRTVAKPLPIASPTMPAPLKLLRSPALAAPPPVTAAGAVVRPLQVPRPECATAPVHGDSIVPAASDGAVTDDNSNSRSLTQPETSVALPPLPLPALVLQTPAHGSAGGSDGLLRRILSPVDAPRVPTQGLFDTPLIATAAAAAVPTPLQPPRAVAAAAVAAAQQTPAAVAPAGAFAIPDTHAAVAIAAPLSLTPLPVLDATAIKTVGRRGTWEARRPHAPLGMMGPSISHWASNDHDPVNEPAAPETDIERQASGGWRNAAVPQWRGTRTAHMVGCAGGGAAVDTPGHVTCFSKVAQRGLAAVDPLVMPSPSVVQPTPRGRHGEDGEEVAALRAGYSPCREDEYDDREGAGDSLGDGAADANAVGEAGHGVYPCGSPAITVERENGTESGAEEEALGEVLASADSPGGHESVAAAVATTNCAGAAVGVAKDPVARSAPVLVAAVPAKEPEPALTAVVATVAAAAGPAWSKELDQLVMKEIFRLGEGQSTWRSISDQLGTGVYTAEVVEARGKLLMARMMQLM